jgi:hypothetical protein
MLKPILQQYIDLNYSLNQINKITGKSKTSIRYWLKKFGLKTNHKKFHKGWSSKTSVFTENGIEYKICPNCEIKKPATKEFYYLKDGGRLCAYCKKCNNKITFTKQKELKIKAVEYKGGKCICCNYDRYVGALEFHHVNPKEKEYSISELRSYTFEVVKIELDKCVLLCKNCHAEVHNGFTKLP